MEVVGTPERLQQKSHESGHGCVRCDVTRGFVHFAHGLRHVGDTCLATTIYLEADGANTIV